ncbi:OmpA family protein [Glaciecola sp. 1036]|uniref:OmpA family protein n=1 Tax=Alteromonadaceae TaxID=72275 RepID=UPI003D0331A2
MYTTKTLLAIAVACSLTVGCSNTSNTQRGAGIGAVVGAIAGKATGDHDKSRYVWGAAIGAIAGAAIGDYMDKQEEQLREELSDTGVQVVRQGDELKLVMPGNLTFDTDSAAVSANFYPVLNDVSAVLKEFDKTRLSIEGHTDSVGDSDYNQDLSIRRANSVAAYLAQRNVDESRLRTLGMGETAPIASNETRSSREQNRRVELKIIPVTTS